MNVITDSVEISTRGHTDIIDITPQLEQALKDSKLKCGNLTVFVSGSTAGITSIEYEPGLLKDLPEAYDKIAPTGVTYHHDAAWGDGNGYAHVRAAMLGASFTVPFDSGRLLLGTWQQIVVIDFDNRPRRRNIVVQMLGK
ncbi:secondary thiamine-phosphate synthase enzyme [Candidatus Scalindua japonica]|uniref:Secondary thiamine-phosphate synthase enzyme n=1 Tax=Candidatus Scalindua japonica TaxID=1284222 RepID=A0A286U173_9BACT|nr:secondary thiamine-phosphate synthase enzyme YjbQ [Candidatus Scalindua japonica]GAX61862.1 secondary thiamine-phosphate synthase enzyme [Candidatus Scalindua japonica]